jgi:hypothetical protein
MTRERAAGWFIVGLLAALAVFFALPREQGAPAVEGPGPEEARGAHREAPTGAATTRPGSAETTLDCVVSGEATLSVLRPRPALTTLHLVSWEQVAAAPTRERRAHFVLAPGTYQVVAEGPGGRARETLDLAERKAVTLHLELQSGPTLEGRVEADGHAVPQARLSLTPFQRAVPRATDANEAVVGTTVSAVDGTFALHDVTPGVYTLEAVAPGLGRARLEHVAVPGPPVVVRLEASASVEGHVLLPDGAPAVGALVTASGGDDVLTTTSSDTGAFALEVQPGALVLTAKLGALAGRTKGRLTLSPGRALRSLTLQLGAGATLEGRLTDGADGGLTGTVAVLSPTVVGFPDSVLVMSAFRATAVQATTQTDGEGYYRLEGLPSGEWDVTASSARGQVTTPAVALLEGQRQRLDVAFAEPGTIRGRAVRSDGGVVPNVTVALGLDLDVFPLGLPRVRADARGEYTFTGVPPGRAWVGAWRDGSPTQAQQDVSVQPGPAVSESLLVLDEEDTGLLRGVVTGVEGATIVTAVHLDAARGVQGFTRSVTDGTGHFGVQLAPGHWRIEGFDPTTNRVEVDVVAGEERTVALHVEGLRVLVREADGTPAAHAWVELKADGRTGGEAHVADENGRVMLAVDVAGRSNRLVATCENHGGEARYTWPTQEVIVTCAPAARLDGTVARAGRPVSGFTLSWPQGATMHALHFDGERFSLEEIPSGSWAASVDTDDGDHGVLKTDLAPGAQGTVTVTVAPQQGP